MCLPLLIVSICLAEMQIKDAYEKIAQCKSELNAAKCIRRNRQGNFQLYCVQKQCCCPRVLVSGHLEDFCDLGRGLVASDLVLAQWSC